MKPQTGTLSSLSSTHLWVVITTGDPDGIGLEVTAKALAALGPQAGVQFVFYSSAQDVPNFSSNPSGRRSSKAKTSFSAKPTSASRGSIKARARDGLGDGFSYGKFRRVRVSSLTDARALLPDHRVLIEIVSSASPAAWVEESGIACLHGSFSALVTAPLSKTSIIAAGFSDIGHTEILARVSGRSSLFMGFIGSKFSVVLATGHMPLQKVGGAFNKKCLAAALDGARLLRDVLPPSRRLRPIGLVGVNPHAGESGLLGSEEEWMRSFVSDEVVGPLVPDAAFLPSQWPRFSVYVCPYHDQGLIPFKMIHGFRGGVHLTLGLPFVRTSVDHGTAKDLFGQNRAESGSMQDALKTAVKLARLEKPR